MQSEDNNQDQRAPKGRALQKVRPGLVVKDVLMSKIPIRDSQYVTEASITDLHNAYKNQINDYNILQEKTKRLRGMNVYSFTTLFKFARLLGLVEYVRDEPMHITGSLYHVEDGAKLRIVANTRKIYRLTDKGKEDTISWNNLCGTWRHKRRD
jgi:hypothetical protein